MYERGHRDEASRSNIYEEVTAKIVAELEGGRAPWVQPWDEAKAGLGLPGNAATGRSYSGINILILWLAVIERGFARQRWLTFRQALALGGHVRKGERGVTIVYADRFTPKAEKERVAAEGGEARAVPFLKRFTVFNVEQCEGLPEALIAPPPATCAADVVPHAEALIAATGARFHVGGPRAFYVPSVDCIEVPPQSAFHEPVNYYRTCFHELGHWTGHPSRLDRLPSAGFGSAAYAFEELIAEIACAFVCASLAIIPTVRHADYIASWFDVLRGDARAIFRAASLATKAADYILAFRDGVDDPASPDVGDTP